MRPPGKNNAGRVYDQFPLTRKIKALCTLGLVAPLRFGSSENERQAKTGCKASRGLPLLAEIPEILSQRQDHHD